MRADMGISLGVVFLGLLRTCEIIQGTILVNKCPPSRTLLTQRLFELLSAGRKPKVDLCAATEGKHDGRRVQPTREC
jgi:hypothetical protein